ncbi:HEAT repeat domain-containing protein [Nocardia sp. NPDC055053]
MGTNNDMHSQPRLTPRMRELIAPGRNSRPPVGHLSPSDIEMLITAATHSRSFDEPVNRYRAIQALAAGASPEVSVPILGRIVGEPVASTTERVTAARELGLIATPEAEDALVLQLRDRDPLVQQAVLAGLGMFASRSVLGALDLNEPAARAVEQQLTLTRALIAHRHGLDGPFMPEVEGLRRQPGEIDRTITPTLHVKTAGETAKDRDLLSGSTYGIELSDQSYALTCGRAEWAVFVNREIDNSTATLGRLFERAWIAAIMARWNPQRTPKSSASPQYLILTQPSGGSARINVVRTDGELMYTGAAEQADSTLAFVITDAERSATTPTYIAGNVTANGVDFDVGVVSATRLGTRIAESI